MKTAVTKKIYTGDQRNDDYYPFYDGFNIGFRRGTTGEYDPTVSTFTDFFIGLRSTL